MINNVRDLYILNSIIVERCDLLLRFLRPAEKSRPTDTTTSMEAINTPAHTNSIPNTGAISQISNAQIERMIRENAQMREQLGIRQ